MDLKLLHKYESEGLLFSQKHPSLPLTIWNYSDKVQYEGLWDETLLQCRGLVTDDEGNVVDCTFGPFRYVESGKEKEDVVLSNIVIEHKGYPVSVGSGFSLDQRKHYMKNPKAIIGKTVTVQYFEESKNQEGGISLRFPTVKHIYDNGRDC